MNDYLIYMHIKKTDKTPFYIGKGKIDRAYTKKGRNKYWHNIVNKYDFEVEILESNLIENEALKKEIYWIKKIGRFDLNLGPLVNMTDGGEGFRGNHTKETKQKISLNNARSFKGKIHSEESKKKMSNSKKGSKCYWLGKERSEEMKKIISKTHKGNNYRLGKTHSEESKKKMSNSKLNKGTKKVHKLTVEGKFLCEYTSIKEAAFLNSTKPGMISRVCRGERNSHLGFIWYTPD
jgi:group I intron endonuclease